METGLLWLGLTLGLLALAAIIWSSRLEGRAGLPEGKVIYSDMGAWVPHNEPLYAPEWQLAGRPDYLVKRPDGSIMPVEVKSSSAPSQPYDSHILQLAAYCLLVEANYGVRPECGVLQYRDKAFAVEYTKDLEEDLLDLLTEMRADLLETNVDRDHNDWRRCARCSLRQHCYQRLA